MYLVQEYILLQNDNNRHQPVYSLGAYVKK